MKPRPDYQRRQAHRQRLALGRALHQVRMARTQLRRHMTAPGREHRFHLGIIARNIKVPRIVRKHAGLLRSTFAVLGS